MIHYDLTDTRMAQNDQLHRVPTEGELLAVMVGLMLFEGCGFEELSDRMLILRDDNHESVAQMIEEHLWPLLLDIGFGQQLRARLKDLVGLQISGSVG